MSEEPDPHALTMRDLSQPIDELDAQRVYAELSEAFFDRGGERARIGRFVVLDRVGMGGMGTVYAAFDPTLDRKVAIKLLHPSAGGTEDEAVLHDRLRREAKALAKLRHPNVVTVHEVGVVGQQTFVAMEYVKGSTLEAWLATPRPWRQVVRVFIDAGRGLVGAHDAGLVHRDFKPANAILDDDGRVIVVDFGLARIDAEQRPDLAGDSLVGTRTRGVAGTPAYMAPEQLRGETADAASDQFSFCVSLWEALHGARPFDAPTPMQRLDDIDQRRIVEPPVSRRTPRWLRRALRRGLEPEATDRWPSMQALLDQLERGLSARGRRLAVSGTVVVAVVGGVWAWGQREVAPGPVVDPCEAEVAVIDEVWDEQRAARIETAVDAGSEGTARRGARVVQHLDAYAGAWRAARDAACHGTPPADPRQRVCYDARLDDLRAAAELLEAPDAVVRRRALELVPSAAALSECDLAVPTPARAPGQGWAEASLMLARTRALTLAGRYDEARQEAEAALALARAHDDATLHARAELTLARLSMSAGNEPEALRHLEAAEIAAERGGDTVTRLSILRAMVEAFIDTADLDRAAHALAVVEAAHTRFEPRPPLWDARLGQLRGELAIARGDYDIAQTELIAALAIAEAVPEAEVADVLIMRSRLAAAYFHARRWPEAVAELERAEQQEREHSGDFSPGLAATLSMKGAVAMARDDGERDLDAARAALEEAMRIRTALAGPDDPSVLKTLQNLAAVHSRAGRSEQALALQERALELHRQHGLRTFNTAQTQRNVAIILTHLKRFEEAAAHYQEANAVLVEVRGDDEAAAALRASGDRAREAGQHEQAIELYRQAFTAILERDRAPARPG